MHVLGSHHGRRDRSLAGGSGIRTPAAFFAPPTKEQQAMETEVLRQATIRTSRLVNRNVRGRGCAGRRTSMRLEPELWDALDEICQREGRTPYQIVDEIDRTRTTGGRTSALRVFLFTYFRSAATEQGHDRAGHGRHLAARN